VKGETMDYRTYFQEMHTPFLKGKAAIVTGGDGEIGIATAKAMLELGADVVLSAEQESAGIAFLQERLNDHGSGRLVLYRETLSSEETAKRLIMTAVEQFGHLNILVNNFDCCDESFITESDSVQWDTVFDSSVKIAYYLSKFAADEFIKNRYGKIVSVTSFFGKSGQIATGVSYAASKSAMFGFSKMLAKQLGEYGVTVNSVAVGLMDSQKKLVEDNLHLLPQKRGARPEEIAIPIVYLSSKFSDYITGYCMDVNGGLYLD